MTIRITNLASNNRTVALLLRTQSRVHDSQITVSSGQTSEDYIGIGNQTERLLNLENSSTLLNRYILNNELMELRLKTAVSALGAVEDSIKEFRLDLANFAQNTNKTLAAVRDLQESAIRGLKGLEAYLNTEAAGRFLFSGSRVNSEPVNFKFTTLADFQALYDGNTITFPTTRDTNIHPKLTASTGKPGNPTTQGYTNLTFTDATETITAANAGAFGNIPVGAKITITGTTGGTYDKTFTVSSNDGTNIVVTEGLSSGNLASQTGATITFDTSYYKGDERTLTHRVDDNRSLTYDSTAVNPSFEKAIRAMGIIAQGAFGTTGGLDQNLGRVDQAKFLIDASLFVTVAGTPPFGAEKEGSLEELRLTIGFQQVLLDLTNTTHKNFISFQQRRILEIETADPLEAITRLTSDTRTLEASYRALARIRELGLQDFL